MKKGREKVSLCETTRWVVKGKLEVPKRGYHPKVRYQVTGRVITREYREEINPFSKFGERGGRPTS